MGLGGSGDTAEFGQCLPAGLYGSHAGPDVVVNVQIEMTLEFVSEVPLV